MDMAEQQGPAAMYSGATMSSQAPPGSNSAPSSQTPGHPSFRRFVISWKVCSYYRESVTDFWADNVRQELVR
jgi:hypothetical protein